jgi:hypothetical protein
LEFVKIAAAADSFTTTLSPMLVTPEDAGDYVITVALDDGKKRLTMSTYTFTIKVAYVAAPPVIEEPELTEEESAAAEEAAEALEGLSEAEVAEEKAEAAELEKELAAATTSSGEGAAEVAMAMGAANDLLKRVSAKQKRAFLRQT